MAELRRFRWVTWIALLVLLALLLVCEIKKWWICEAFVLIGLFADLFAIVLKTRCPYCKGRIPLHPPFFEGREFCRHCGTRLE